MAGEHVHEGPAHVAQRPNVDRADELLWTLWARHHGLPPLSRSVYDGQTVSRARQGTLSLQSSRHEAPAALITARHRASLRRFSGWFVLGVAAFGGEVVLLGVLHQWLKCPLWLASALAAECVLLARFLSTDRLVFGYPA